MVQTISGIGPGHTPRVVLKLIIAIVGLSLFSALWESLLSLLIGVPPLQPYFALSTWGISNFFLWQFVSYLFFVDSYGGGITLFYLISLLFNAYILWIMGTAICEYGGRKELLQLFFTSGVVAGVIGITLLWLFGVAGSFSGPAPALLALFTVWSLLNPEMELLLFFVFPIRIKWLFALIVGAILLINLSQLNPIHFFFYMTGIATGYCFAAFKWELGSPFSWTEGLDRYLVNLGRKIREKRSAPKEKSESKIIELFTGKPPLDDEAFIDAMLNKISEQGPDSLTRAEKKRMDSIAEKRKK